MTLRDHKTKIVATIGPASASPETLRAMIRAGMDVARLNFSHGDFEGHHRAILLLREAARAERRRLAILADLPGPKIRLGRLATEPITLQAGGEFTLTTEDITGDHRRASVSFTELPKAARTGDVLFLNDGLIELEVLTVSAHDVACRVRVGGDPFGSSTCRNRSRYPCSRTRPEHPRSRRRAWAISQSFVSRGGLAAVRRLPRRCPSSVRGRQDRAGAGVDRIDEIWMRPT
jgi:pyruvate kinase